MRIAAVVLGLVLVGCGPQVASSPSSGSGGSAGSGLTTIRPGLATALSVPDGYVATPHGYYHASCVHDAIETAHQPCAYPRVLVTSQVPGIAQGWIEDASFMAQRPATKMTSEIVVPSAPSSIAGQIDYFFPGMEPADGSIILQPVLAWGANPAGGGSYYNIASWSCGESCVHGNVVEVKPGDKIVGTITGESCTTSGSCDWSIETKDETSDVASTLRTTNDTNPYTWLFAGVLEAYNVTACDELPAAGDVKYSGIKFADQTGATITAAWQKQTLDGSLGCDYGIKTTKETAQLSFPPGVPHDLGVDMRTPPSFDLAGGGQGTFDGGSMCQYSCAEYGFTAGQCYSGWLCNVNGCLSSVSTCPAVSN